MGNGSAAPSGRATPASSGTSGAAAAGTPATTTTGAAASPAGSVSGCEASGGGAPDPPPGCVAPCLWRVYHAPDPAGSLKRMTLDCTKQLWLEFLRHAAPALDIVRSEDKAAAAAAGGASNGLPGRQHQQQRQQDDEERYGMRLDQEHQFLYYGSAKLPEGLQAGSARARLYQLVRTCAARPGGGRGARGRGLA